MKKTGRSKTKRNILITVAVAIAITLIVASALRNQNSSQKPPASEYLKVEHTRSLGEFFNNGKTVNIKELGLRITAVGGDATNILITGLRTQGEEYPSIDFLRKGESKEITVQLSSYVTSLNETIGLFPVNFTIGCSEASASDITIYLKPDDIEGPHY
jgi:hypothetical protein